MAFVAERHSIYRRRQAGKPKPWTADKTLQRYFFCNMYRELDRVTVWIRDYWREPYSADPDVWFAMTVARLVNWPDTLAALGYPVPWDAGHFVRVLEDREKRGEKVFHQAYKPPTPRCKGERRIPFVADMLSDIWAQRDRLRRIMAPGTPLWRAHAELMTCEGLGSFLAAQVVADLKYVPPLTEAPDWWTFAASGPGSKRGLNRVLGRRPDSSWTEGAWYRELIRLAERVRPVFEATNGSLPIPHNQDLQNMLCEWDKIERIRTEPERASLRRYPGKADEPELIPEAVE
jgi:hypothetical protein